MAIMAIMHVDNIILHTKQQGTDHNLLLIVGEREGGGLGE